MRNIVEISKEGEKATIRIHLQSFKATKIILSVALAICILLPLSIFVAALATNDASPILLIIIPLFMYIFARGVLKQLMWQCYGYEEFSITSQEVVYAPNIRYFKMETQSIPSNNLEVLLVDRELIDDLKIGRISFMTEDANLRSTLKITESEYNKLLTLVRMAIGQPTTI